MSWIELEAGDACGDWNVECSPPPVFKGRKQTSSLLSCPYGQPCRKEDMRLLLHSYSLLIDCKYLCQMFNLTIYWPSSDDLLSGNESSPSAKKSFSTPTELKIGYLTHRAWTCCCVCVCVSVGVLICMLFARSVSEQGVSSEPAS